MRSTSTPHTRSGWARRLVASTAAVSLGALGLVGIAVAPASAVSPGCSYGTGGTDAAALCWIDMSGYNPTLANSAPGQHMSVSLPGGDTLTFDVHRAAGGGGSASGPAASTTPVDGLAELGAHIYVGTTGKTALYQTTSNGTDVITLSNIAVTDAQGDPTTGYGMVAADAGSSVTNERVTLSSDRPLTQVVEPGNPALCGGGLSGLGSTQVTCNGSWATATHTLVVGATQPSSMQAVLVGGALEGVAFAVDTSSVGVGAVINGRPAAADSIDVSISDGTSTVSGPNTSGAAPATTASTGQLSLLGRTPGLTYTLSQAATTGSGTDLSNYAKAWTCTNGGVAYTGFTVVPGSDSIQVTPNAGDEIRCTVKDTYTDNFTGGASLTTSVNTPIVTPLSSFAQAGPGGSLDPTTVTATASHGSTSVDPTTGAVTFTPDPGFSGPAGYNFKVCDHSAPVQCAQGFVSVTVTNVFQGGPAATAGISTPQNTAVTTPLTDIVTTTGAAIDPASVTQTTAPTHGSIAIDPATGAVTYTPTAGYSGPDSYTVNVCSTTAKDCIDETVPVAVGANVVTAAADTAVTTVGTAVTTDVRANDTSASGQAWANPTVAVQPAHGAATVNADGTISYTPTAAFSGADSFTYQVCDTSTPTPVCATAQVAVTMDNVFSPGPGISTAQNQAVTTPLSGIATTSGKPLDPTLVTTMTVPAHGSISIDPSTGAVTYVPAAGYTGSDSYVVNVCDTSSPAQCQDVAVPASVGPNVVTANADSAATSVATPVTTDVRGNDTSASGQALAAPTVTTGPTHGTAVVNADGTITYTPTAGFSGQDAYGYQVCDTSIPTPVCGAGTVSIVVSNVFSGGSASTTGVTTPQNAPITSLLTDIVTAAGSAIDPASVTQVASPAHGSISIDPTTGAVAYTPTAGYSGPDAYTVNVCDTAPVRDCHDETVKVTVTPNVVTGASYTAATGVGKPTTVDVLAGIHSASGQALGKPSISTTPKHGTATVNPDGTITYAPDKSFVGVDSFTYTVCDTGSPKACVTKTITVQVRAAATSAVGLTLPDTGGPSAAWWLAAGAALIAGCVLMISGRRRQS